MSTKSRVPSLSAGGDAGKEEIADGLRQNIAFLLCKITFPRIQLLAVSPSTNKHQRIPISFFKFLQLCDVIST
jgi:hypothetical protein